MIGIRQSAIDSPVPVLLRAGGLQMLEMDLGPIQLHRGGAGTPSPRQKLLSRRLKHFRRKQQNEAIAAIAMVFSSIGPLDGNSAAAPQGHTRVERNPKP